MDNITFIKKLKSREYSRNYYQKNRHKILLNTRKKRKENNPTIVFKKGLFVLKFD